MVIPRIYADFHNADAAGRLRLNNAGTLEDLSKLQLELREGMAITLYSDDVNEHGDDDELEVDGNVTYSNEENCWVASIDWKAIRHSSNMTPARNGSNTSGPILPVDVNVTNR